MTTAVRGKTLWDVDEIQIWSRQFTSTDLSDIASWYQYTSLFDDLGRRYEMNGIYDDGRVWQTQWDVIDTQTWARQYTYTDLPNTTNWTSYSVNYDVFGRRYEQIGIYDDGRTWQTLWDVDDAEIWSRQTTTQDSADIYAWHEMISQYDDIGNWIGTTVIDDAIV